MENLIKQINSESKKMNEEEFIKLVSDVVRNYSDSKDISENKLLARIVVFDK
jgi:hypothetical protein